MGFEPYKESYSGKIKEVTLGGKGKSVTVGGENCYPFYTFEGAMPKKPLVAMEVWDMKPTEWPEAVVKPFEDVLDDPVAWAKKCVDEYGADLIVLQLKSTDPNDKDASPADAAAMVKKVAEAISVPLLVWGTASPKKDEDVLKKVAEECQGLNLTLGPVEDKNHKGIGAAAMGFGHALISSSPIDVNLAKQVNILLENLGVPLGSVVVDPTTGGLGYGMEYSYSVMERLNMAALTQGDDKLQNPLINNLGNEIWKCKEAKMAGPDDPTLGDPEKRGILMEAVGAVCYLLAGSNILIIRHPESARLAKAYIDLISDGGSAAGVAGITKKLDAFEADLAASAPAPDLTIEEEKKAAPKPAAKKEAPKAEAKPAPAAAPKAAPAAAPKEEPKAEAAPAAPAAPAVDEAQQKAEAEAKAKLEAKAKAEAEAKAKAEADAKAKAEAEAKAKAEAAEAARKAEVAKREAEENDLRAKRAAEAEKRAAARAAAKAEGEAVSMTAAAEQKSAIDKLIDNLSRVHRW